MTRVLVTRAREQASELVHRLEALGYVVISYPLIEIEALGDDPVDVEPYDWIVLTSVNGARELRRRMRGQPKRVAAIGRATADAFGHADLVPVVATQEGLLAELPQSPGRVLFAGAENARRLIVDTLGAEFLALYRTRELTPLEVPAGDVALVASPSAARALARAGGALPVVSIGPETTRAAETAGLEVVAEAETHDAAGLVAALEGAVPPAP
jgi:uroporphyrinogen III methyltransferase / synthase